MKLYTLENKFTEEAKYLPDKFTGIAEYPNGTLFWYKNDKLHKEDGPTVEYPDGSKLWYLKGKYHRLNGPAIEWSCGSKGWLIDGKKHRIDGPACIYNKNRIEYWLYDTLINTKLEHKLLVNLLKIKGLI